MECKGAEKLLEMLRNSICMINTKTYVYVKPNGDKSEVETEAAKYMIDFERFTNLGNMKKKEMSVYEKYTLTRIQTLHKKLYNNKGGKENRELSKN